jgi:hypothetical protein
MAKSKKPFDKKLAAPSPGAAKKQTLLTYGARSKGLAAKTPDIFDMGDFITGKKSGRK